MSIQIYDKATSDFSRNGRVLQNTLSCYIEEELNGLYVLELEHPIDEPGKWKELQEGNIIKADNQLFRIYRKIKTLRGIKIYARHIFYDLVDNFLEDARPTNLNANDTLNWILSHTVYSHRFTAFSDIETVNTKYFIRKNPIEAIMAEDGVIENWGGELVRDNYNIKLLQARGADNGVLIAYGKNLVGIEEELDMIDVVTMLMPIGDNGLLLLDKYIASPLINNYPHPIIRKVEFSGCTTEAELRAAGAKYMSSGVDKPKVNYKVNFIELSKTEEYKNYAVLQTVNLGDTVIIRHRKLGFDLKAKAIHIKYKYLANGEKRIEEIELGSFKNNFLEKYNEIIREKEELRKSALLAATKIEILGGARALSFDVHGSCTTSITPYSLKVTQFGKEVAPQATIWSTSGLLEGASSSTTFTPIPKAMYSPMETWVACMVTVGDVTLQEKIYITIKSIGFRGLGEWSPLTVEYIHDENYIDLVTHAGSTFYCKVSHTSDETKRPSEANPPVDNDYWGVSAMQGIQGPIGEQGQTGTSYRGMGAWVSTTSYACNAQYIDTVGYNGSLFASRVDNNLNHQPPSTPITDQYWYCLAAKGDKGDTGPVLDWVQDWDGTKVDIKGDKIITPKIFAGINGGTPTTPVLTGVAIGRDVLSGTDTKIGIVGYNANKKTYELGTDGKAHYYGGGMDIFNNAGVKTLDFDSNGNAILSGKVTAGGTNKIELDNGVLNFIAGGAVKHSTSYYNYPTTCFAHNSLDSTGNISNVNQVYWQQGEYLNGKIYNQVVSCYCPASETEKVFQFTVNIASYGSVGIANILGMFANSLAVEFISEIVAPVFTDLELSGYQLRVRSFGATPAMTIKVTTTIIGGR